MSETPPEKQSDSISEQSDKATKHLENVGRLSKTLQSFAEQLAKLIVTKNWVSLLLLIDSAVFLFFFPDVGIVPKLIETIFGIKKLHKLYPAFFWLVVIGIFIAALFIAVKEISSKPPSLPDFTERKAIKGLRAFTKEDAEIFARLERKLDLRECLESITSQTFCLGILTGESGVGKSSFLQAGIIPQLAKEESSYRGIYIRFSNQEPIATIDKALVEELKLSATETIETNDRDLLEIFSSAAKAADKPLILIFDQFEQFFVHFQQKQDREPFIDALQAWYCADNPLPIKILISIRGDLADRLIELQKALGYSLSPYEIFRLDKFTPTSATKILRVIAQAAEIPFDAKFVKELTQKELASREDGLISPVDLQVLARTIERQDNNLQAFNRKAFQKIGGIEGLMTHYLKTTLDAREIPRQRKAAINVLLSLTDLNRNVRAGALTIEEIRQKTKGTLTLEEIDKAVTWLVSSRVRLATTIEQNENIRYELAHERLISALREIAGEELSSVDRANQLLDRRVNEWLGNRKSDRYLFNWKELRLLQKQPHLNLRINKSAKENLLKRSWKKVTRQIVAIAMVSVLVFVGMCWWYSPLGQIQQVRWDLQRLSKRVRNPYRGKAAIAFFKDRRFQQALEITDSINDSHDRAFVLSEIAMTHAKLGNLTQAEKFLNKAITATEQINDSDYKGSAIVAIVNVIGKLENLPQAEEYFDKAITATEQIDNSDDRTWALMEIANVVGKLDNLSQVEKSLDKVIAAIQKVNDSDDKAWALTEIVEVVSKLDNLSQVEKSLDKVIATAKTIDDSDDKAWMLSEIAEIIGKLENFYQAEKYLDKVVVAAQTVDDSYDKVTVLNKIAETYGKLENFYQVEIFLDKALITSQQIDSQQIDSQRIDSQQIDSQRIDSQQIDRLTSGISIDNYLDYGTLLVPIQKIREIEELSEIKEYFIKIITAILSINSYSDYRTKSLIATAHSISEIENFPQARKYLDKVFIAAGQLSNSEINPYILIEIANAHNKLKNFSQAREYLDKSIIAAQEIDYLDYETNISSKLANAYSKQRNFSQTEKYLDKAIIGAQSLYLAHIGREYRYSKIKVFEPIMETIVSIENFPQAQKYIDKIIDTTKQINDPSDKTNFLIEIARIVDKIKDYSQAERYLDKVIATTLKLDSLRAKSRILIEVVWIADKMKDYSQAEKYLDKVIAATLKLDDSTEKAEIFAWLSQIYEKREKFSKAQECLDRAIIAIDQIDSSYSREQVLISIAQMQAKFSKWRQAHHTASKCPTDECKAESLTHILTAWTENKNPALVDNQEDEFSNFYPLRIP